MAKKHHIRKSRKNLLFTPPFVVFVIVFALIGSYYIFRGHAATFTASTEAENGTLSAKASVVANANASGGNAVKFGGQSLPVSSTNPCIGAAKPAQWKHVIVLMFENHSYNQVIGDTVNAPYITSLAGKCGTSKSWYDSDFKSPGVRDGTYVSKPSYATLTNGVSPSVHGLTDDSSSTKTTVDNIYRQLRRAGKTGKDYYDAAGSGCSVSFVGSYHDAIRYYNGDSGADAAYCNAHDVSLSTFMTDVNNNTLPDFSMILPTNCENMHSCSTVSNVVKNGDTWAKNFLTPLLDSARYKSGDTAIFFLWDEDTPIPNVLIAPSVKTGSTAPNSSHFGATRTWDEMLGLPYIGVTNTAPHPSEDLLNFYNGQ